MSNLRHVMYCQQCARWYIIDSVIEQSVEALAGRHHFLVCTGLTDALNRPRRPPRRRVERSEADGKPCGFYTSGVDAGCRRELPQDPRRQMKPGRRGHRDSDRRLRRRRRRQQLLRAASDPSSAATPRVRRSSAQAPLSVAKPPNGTRHVWNSPLNPAKYADLDSLR